VSETNRFNVLRLRYKAAFDAYAAIANRNADIVRNGGSPSAEERAEEERAAADLQAVRDKLMASTARLGI
jgi:hypothetical protein